jgi:hypothetical protein
MGHRRTVLCLANSRKPPSGRCVAGKEFANQGFGPWIRPVSSRPGHEISEEERQFEDGTSAQVLDIVEIPLLEARALSYQTENHLIDEHRYWTKRGSASWAQVRAAVDDFSGPLWVDGHSTCHGLNDKVPEDLAAGLDSSLKLIQVRQLRLDVVSESGYEGRPPRRRVRAAFGDRAHRYSMVVTDPVIESEYFAKKNGSYTVSDAIVCVSLSEVFSGHVHKLAAAVITRERCTRAT